MKPKRLDELLDKRVLWIIIIILFTVIFILLSGMLSGSFSHQYSSGLLSALGTFGGALVGAFGAGYFTLLSVEKQIRSGEINSKINEINSHLRVGTDYIARVNAVVYWGEHFIGETEDDIANSKQSRFLPKTHSALNNYSGILTNTLKELNTLNYQVVPFDYYKEYIGSKEIVKILSSLAPHINGDLNQSSPLDQIYAAPNYSEFIKYHDQLKSSLNNIKIINDNEQRELLSITEEKNNSIGKSQNI
ncbi:hypothetical protein [Planococcus dechangensis]|uniref:Uncharacterized protein n=1 Tax=Planococcus dechangensis TaxID=1176255 RepID=A0ABV9MCE5_9BACL